MEQKLEHLRKENHELKEMIINKMLLPKYKRPLISQTERAFALMPENMKATLMRQTLEMLYNTLTTKLTTELAPTMVKQAEIEIRTNVRVWAVNEIQKILKQKK